MKIKKLFTAVAFIAILAAFAVPAFAGTFGEDYGEIPWAPTAPVMDGQMDDVYADGLFYVMDHLKTGCVDSGSYA